MTEQTIITQSEQEHMTSTPTEAAPAPEQAKPKAKQPRQLVRFTFYKLDPAVAVAAHLRRASRASSNCWRSSLSSQSGTRSCAATACYGLRSDCDFMLWQATYNVEDLQGISSGIRRSTMGPYLREAQAFSR